jgi:hypothetical protein
VRARRIVVVVVLALLAAGCGAEELVSLRMPKCGEVGARTTFLMAQSVPHAGLVPCIDAEALPADLFMEDMRIDSTGARFTFFGDWPAPDADTATPLRLEVRFTSSCDVGDAVAVPSDEPDARRLERVERVAAGYAGERFYVFDGGCVTYRFDAQGDAWLSFVHEASQTWTFMPRTEVERLRDVALGACGDGSATNVPCDR